MATRENSSEAGEGNPRITPPSSRRQSRIDRGRVIRSVDKLTTDLVIQCADVWAALVACDLKGQLQNGNPSSLWALVFKDGWKSDDDQVARERPPNIANRTSGASMTQCGIFGQDLPVPPKGKVPHNRLKGDPAFVKVHGGGLAGKFNFFICDSRGRLANEAFVEFFDGEKLSILSAWGSRGKFVPLALTRGGLAVFRRIADNLDMKIAEQRIEAEEHMYG
ncbi:hypothetical protein B0T26DRAFT_745236 [Lasiosphaeria miniovina]|uniref:Uncharacterized protein n=1 Tax=Lasiosphaeria miniovina TaxID=1954250 RepID=A0AA40BF95_9PEZI|nr:uncharacterized protein B0T26DRAFT_745236 [Lasiosphaeria miniovina]KAK0733155.1 hypothetical protein B0T26DRAFT_745236 [Lasiosphaeria miniovina]